MKKNTLVILCVVFALVMLGAGALYGNLSQAVQPGGLATMPPETQAATQATQTDATTLPPETTVPQVNTAPDFTMLDREGNPVKLSQFFGKPIVLNFWASWCGPCKMEMPDIQEFYEKYGEDVHFLMVNCTDGSRETVETAEAFLEGTDYTFPVYFDTTSMGAYTYGAGSIPLTFFIDADGNPQAYYMGAMPAEILQQGIDLIYQPEA